jgi:hypothetical protein
MTATQVVAMQRLGAAAKAASDDALESTLAMLSDEMFVAMLTQKLGGAAGAAALGINVSNAVGRCRASFLLDVCCHAPRARQAVPRAYAREGACACLHGSCWLFCATPSTPRLASRVPLGLLLPPLLQTEVLARYTAELDVSEIAHAFPAAYDPDQNNALDVDIGMARNATWFYNQWQLPVLFPEREVLIRTVRVLRPTDNARC